MIQNAENVQEFSAPFSNSEDFYIVEHPSAKALGLYAGRRYAKGEAIYPFDYWSAPLMPMHVTNHSCDANGKFVDEMLIATRDIAPHEEITFNYLDTRLPASPWDFECLCGSANCVGRVRVKTAQDE